MNNIKTHNFDVVVVGAGGSGLRAVMGCDAVPILNSRTFRSEIPRLLPCSKRWEISFPATDKIDFAACGGRETRSLVISYT